MRVRSSSRAYVDRWRCGASGRAGRRSIGRSGFVDAEVVVEETVSQAFASILNNAADASQASGVNRIAVLPRIPSDTKLSIAVSDWGTGLSAETCEARTRAPICHAPSRTAMASGSCSPTPAWSVTAAPCPIAIECTRAAAPCPGVATARDALGTRRTTASGTEEAVGSDRARRNTGRRRMDRREQPVALMAATGSARAPVQARRRRDDRG
jgi:hypothetical protein